MKVPKANVIGVVGEGFKQTMFNFNHERWLLCAQACKLTQTCVRFFFRKGRRFVGFSCGAVEAFRVRACLHEGGFVEGHPEMRLFSVRAPAGRFMCQTG